MYMDKQFNMIRDDRVNNILALLRGVVNMCLFILASIGMFQTGSMSPLNNIWFVVWMICIFRLIDGADGK